MGKRPRRSVIEHVNNAQKVLAAEHIENVYVGPVRGQPPVSPAQHPPRILPERDRRFAGRKVELAEIHQRLTKQKVVGVSQQVAAYSHGGVGKTSLAVEYAWLHLGDYPGGACSLNCAVQSVTMSLAALAEPLGLPACDGENSQDTAQRVCQHLEAGQPSLLILDNVRDAAQWNDPEWRRYLPGGNCRRLITTRCEHLPGADMYPIEHLSTQDGIELLANYREDAGTRANRPFVEGVVEWFDGLAVGLAVVGIYMSLPMNRRVSWKAYVDSLKKDKLAAVRSTEDKAGSPPGYSKRVDQVFDELLEVLGTVEVRALEYAALLPPDNIVGHWLTWLLEHDGQAKLKKRPGYDRPAEAVMADLVERRLLVPREKDGAILGLHRVLRHRLNERLKGEGKRRGHLLDRIEQLAEARGQASHDALTDRCLRPELTPLLELTKSLEEHGRLAGAVSLANWIHKPLTDLGRYLEDRDSLACFVCAKGRVRAVVGQEEYATLLGNFAMALAHCGDFRSARSRMEQAIRTGGKYFATDHPTLAIRYSNLAIILHTLGDLKGARSRMEQSIRIDEKNFPADHPTLATSYSNLAMILQDLGDLKGARDRMEQAIRIDEKNFPADHPTLATSYSNLAMILQDLGDLKGARDRMEQSIRIDEKNFAADHPVLATSYSNLAMILKKLGDLKSARDRMEQSIRIAEKNFPADHPTLATSYNNLAHIELDEGRVDRATELWLKARRILRKHFPDHHPHVQAVSKILHACGVRVPVQEDGETRKAGKLPTKRHRK